MGIFPKLVFLGFVFLLQGNTDIYLGKILERTENHSSLRSTLNHETKFMIGVYTVIDITGANYRYRLKSVRASRTDTSHPIYHFVSAFVGLLLFSNCFFCFIFLPNLQLIARRLNGQA